jgi:CheY-like chemotaxis protein
MRDVQTKLAQGGEQALEAVQDEEPDVMVLDLKMPGMDGMEVLRRIKSAFPGVPVVMLTGHGTKQDEEQARELGAYAYLQKPVDLEHLVVTSGMPSRTRSPQVRVGHDGGDLRRTGT